MSLRWELKSAAKIADSRTLPSSMVEIGHLVSRVCVVMERLYDAAIPARQFLQLSPCALRKPRHVQRLTITLLAADRAPGVRTA